jgi:hypothetical protein
MRLKEEIVREGEFWLPGDKENSVIGKIFIRENQKIILEINGSIRDASFYGVGWKSSFKWFHRAGSVGYT